MDSISFLPSILWSAIGLWLGTVICSFLYLRYVKSRHPNSKIRLDGDSFLVKTFLVASSLISIFSIGTGVQFFNPSAGLDQFFVIFVLVVWLKYALSDLKQKLDSFVVPKILEEEPETVEYIPPIIEQVEETETPQSTVAGLGDLLRILKHFMNVWEQYERLNEQERLQSISSVLSEGRVVGDLLLSDDTQYGDSWGQELKRLVQATSDALHKFGISDRTDQAYEAKGKDAYDKTSALLSFLKAHTTG